MHPTTVNNVKKEIWRLALAEHDMRLVASTAQLMATEGRSDEVLEAGIVVIYCRSFSGPPKNDWKPKHVVDKLAPEGNLHGKLFEVRSKVYAHTDEDYRNRRDIADVYGDHSYSVRGQHLNPELLFPIRATALALADRFQKARHEREQKLRDAQVPPEIFRFD